MTIHLDAVLFKGKPKVSFIFNDVLPNSETSFYIFNPSWSFKNKYTSI